MIKEIVVGMDRKQSIKGAKDDLRFWYEK